MSDLAVVSIDMFQTLVSVDSRRHHVWQEILKERYSEQLAEEYWALATKVVLDYFHRLTSQEFLTVKAIFERSFAEVFSRIGLDFDPQAAAQILATQHRYAPPYQDARMFLEAVAEQYPVCLVSDTDDDMLSPFLLSLGRFDSVFTSEQSHSYKNDPECKLFLAVVEHYGIPPGNIIHIGDATSDVLGAHRVGMKTCWVNRNGDLWRHDVRPDHTVRTLREAASILGVNINRIA